MKKQKVKKTETIPALPLEEEPEGYKKTLKCRQASHKELRETMDIMKAPGIRY